MLGMEAPETEIERVKREVERRKRVAEENGLDRLFLEVYHRSVRYYPAWVKSDNERRYVYPGVTETAESIEKNPSGDVYVTEFTIGGRKYRITSERRGNILTHDLYYIMNLYVNGERAFAVSEKHDVRLENEHYYALNIDAYASNDWVEDFWNIRDYQRKMEREDAAIHPDDPVLAERLRKDFGIGYGSQKIIRMKAWPHYKYYRLALLLMILILALLTFAEFSTLLTAP